jgi:phage recombination protein Bet
MKSEIVKAGMTSDKIELIGRTIAKGCSPDELALFVAICDRTGLDPFARQIYAIPRWDGKLKRNVMTPQVSIDGARLVAQRSGQYAGQDGPYWCGEDGVWKDVWLSNKLPVAAKVGVMRTGFAAPIYSVALFGEYAQRFDDGNLSGLWKKFPVQMIAKCAEMLSLRRVFPAELSGLYSAEEMSQADTPVVDAVVAEPRHDTGLKRLQLATTAVTIDVPSTPVAVAAVTEPTPGRGGSAASAGALTLPAGAEMSDADDSDLGYDTLVITEVERAMSRSANPQEFLRITTQDGMKMCCWDSHLFAKIEDCVGKEVRAVVQYPPPSTAARGAKPKITEIVGAKQPAKREEVDDANIPF